VLALELRLEVCSCVVPTWSLLAFEMVAMR